MKWKIIFFDLDGTLVDCNFFLSESIKLGVQEIRKLGLRVAIATGRSQKSAKFFLEQLQITEKCVFHNGAVISNDVSSYDVLGKIEKSVIDELLVFSKTHPLSFKLHFPNNTIIKSNNKEWPGENIHFEVGAIINDLSNIDLSNVIKVVFYEPEEKLKKLQDQLGMNLSIKFLQTHLNHIEIINSQVSKSSAIFALLKSENFGIDKIIAVGDQENDYGMIKDAGLGIFVGNDKKIEAVSDLKMAPLFAGGMEQLISLLKQE